VALRELGAGLVALRELGAAGWRRATSGNTADAAWQYCHRLALCHPAHAKLRPASDLNCALPRPAPARRQRTYAAANVHGRSRSIQLSRAGAASASRP